MYKLASIHSRAVENVFSNGALAGKRRLKRGSKTIASIALWLMAGYSYVIAGRPSVAGPGFLRLIRKTSEVVAIRLRIAAKKLRLY